MKLILLNLILAAALSIGAARAGDVWEWAPGHYDYNDGHGHHSDGWEWAPGHTTWTDERGKSREVWEWAPGHWSVDPE